MSDDSPVTKAIPVPSHTLRATRVGPGTVVLAFDLGTEGLPDAVADRLTPAEREVAGLAVAGWSDVAIAQETGRSRHTVSNLLRRAYKRLGVDSRVELAALAGATRRQHG